MSEVRSERVTVTLQPTIKAKLEELLKKPGKISGYLSTLIIQDLVQNGKLTPEELRTIFYDD